MDLYLSLVWFIASARATCTRMGSVSVISFTSVPAALSTVSIVKEQNYGSNTLVRVVQSGRVVQGYKDRMDIEHNATVLSLIIRNTQFTDEGTYQYNLLSTSLCVIPNPPLTIAEGAMLYLKDSYVERAGAGSGRWTHNTSTVDLKEMCPIAQGLPHAIASQHSLVIMNMTLDFAGRYTLETTLPGSVQYRNVYDVIVSPAMPIKDLVIGVIRHSTHDIFYCTVLDNSESLYITWYDADNKHLHTGPIYVVPSASHTELMCSATNAKYSNRTTVHLPVSQTHTQCDLCEQAQATLVALAIAFGLSLIGNLCACTAYVICRHKASRGAVPVNTAASPDGTIVCEEVIYTAPSRTRERRMRLSAYIDGVPLNIEGPDSPAVPALRRGSYVQSRRTAPLWSPPSVPRMSRAREPVYWNPSTSAVA